MKQIIYENSDIFAATTLKDKAAPEENNLALHVCQDPEKVMKNRLELEKESGIPLENWALPWQKHTDKACRIYNFDKGKGAFDKDTSIMDVDALYTTEPDILIGVFTADCVGIVITDPATPLVAAIHSGWKGTVQSIVYKTCKELIEKGLLHPESANAYFSPSILFDSLEVGEEVIEQVEAIDTIDPSSLYYRTENGKGYMDNQGLCARMLEQLGFKKENIHLSRLDTKKELEDCFSYRNDKKTGEHFTYGFIQKKKQD